MNTVLNSLTHTRSHRYPDNDDKYIDTIKYDPYDKCLDMGYLRLKQIPHRPEFAYLTKLYVDHSNLTELPGPKYLSCLEELTCSNNLLSSLPYYPKLTFLNISDNKIISLNHYHNSSLTYLDCSNNPGFKLDISLPKCENLYINDNELAYINLDLIPQVKILDCENNSLTNIVGGAQLLEINLNHNHLKKLPMWNNLIRLMANHNQIENLQTYPSLLSLDISFNKMKKIDSQPLLKKLTATNNFIVELEEMPHLKLLDVSHNCLTNIFIPASCKYVSIQFNPLTSISVLSADLLSNVKEMEVNFETYKYIYQNYYHSFDSVNIRTDEEKLGQMLKRLNDIFDNNMIRYVYKKFSLIVFDKRENTLYQIALKLYLLYFSTKGMKTLAELEATTEFQYLLQNMTKFYYKTIVVTLYFNGYLNYDLDRSTAPLRSVWQRGGISSLSQTDSTKCPNSHSQKNIHSSSSDEKID